jgi:methylmalonyl-CoA/ethylmalonyl-CoA epimerase
MDNTLTTQLAELVLGIDHVAIAVKDIDASIAWYSSALGFSLAERSEVSGDHTGMLYAVMKSASATVVLIQGTSPESQVSKFLDAYGAGMHHIALAVADLDEAINRVAAAGGIADTPVVSDNGIRQALLQLDPATGLRIELIERHGVSFSKQNVEQLFRALEEKGLY